MIRRHHILLPSLIAAGLAVPAAASATTYCAHASAFACPAGEVDVGANLSAAFTPDDNVADTLNIHAGIYAVATALANTSNDALTVIGDGAGTTKLVGAADVGTVLSSSRLSVSGLTVQLPAAGGQATAVRASGPSATVHDIAVTGGTNLATAISAIGDVAVHHVAATLSGTSTTGVASSPLGGVAPTVTDSTFTLPGGVGISMTAGAGALTVRRVSGSGRSLLQMVGGGATVSDSTWETFAGAFGDLDARCSSGDVDVSLDHVTFSASSGGTTNGIYAECLVAGRHTTVTATNSIFNVLARSFTRAGVAGAETTIRVGSSLFLSGGATQFNGEGGGGFTFFPGNVDDFAGFVNWPSDLRLADGSPAIDQGTVAFTSEVTDLDGNPRPLDGNDDGVVRQDMGAYEHAGASAPVPVPEVVTPPSTLTPSTWTGDPVAPAEATVPEPPAESPPVTAVVPSRGLSVADIRALLRAGIRTGHLRPTGAVQRFAWPTGGRITVTWNARGVLAKGTRVRGIPGRTALAVRRTKAGRAALTPGRLVVLRATWKGGGLKTSVTMRRRIAR